MLEAKLYAIMDEIRLTWEKEIHHLIIEYGSKMIVDRGEVSKIFRGRN